MDKPLESSHRRKKTLRLILTALLITGLLVLAYREFGKLASRPLEISRLLTGTAQSGSIENSITASGRVKPMSELTLTSPLNTRIKTIFLKNGTVVQPGETILDLDTEFAALEYEQLQDELELKDNNVIRMKLELEKNIRDIELDDRIKDLQVSNFQSLLADEERLLKIGGTTQEEVDKARQNLAIARFEKQKLENELEYRKASIESDVRNERIQSSIQKNRLAEIRKKIDLATVKAPVAGVITWLDDNPGNQVTEGSPLVRIANLSQYTIEGRLSDIHTGKIQIGMPVQIRVGRDIRKGHIDQILPAIENNAIQFRISLEDPESENLRPNMEVDVRIVTHSKENGLYIPNGPAVRSGKNQVLFIIGNGEALARSVEIGMRTPEKVEILSGLEAGEKIILSDMSAYEKRPKIRLK